MAITVLYYECCEVASEIVESYSAKVSGKNHPLCWACGVGKSRTGANLDEESPLYGFYRVANKIRPTRETPPWRI